MEGTDEEFTERYRAMLDSHGVARIRTELETISQLNGGKDIVLLCFDDVSKGLCHRTIFAQWWQEKTGEEVKELQKGLEVEQNALFNDRCYSAPSSPDRASCLEQGGTKFDSWGAV